METEKNNIVDGYLFDNKTEYERAKKEYENILKLKKNLKLDDMGDVYNLYTKLAGGNYFSTSVGIGFLHELRRYLVEAKYDKMLIPITIHKEDVTRPVVIDEKYMGKYEKLRAERDRLLALKKKLVIAIAALAFTVVGMIFIVITNDNLGYFNAEEKVLNKYSAWQERLQNWEEELIEREDALK